MIALNLDSLSEVGLLHALTQTPIYTMHVPMDRVDFEVSLYLELDSAGMVSAQVTTKSSAGSKLKNVKIEFANANELLFALNDIRICCGLQVIEETHVDLVYAMFIPALRSFIPDVYENWHEAVSA